MIRRELLSVSLDGIKLYKTYSDQNLMILQNETGVLYSEAIDPENAKRTYSETDILIEISELENEDEEES